MADRIVLVLSEKYDLCNSLSEALQYLADNRELERMLGCYRELMMQTGYTIKRFYPNL
jgi:hypothetical protein